MIGAALIDDLFYVKLVLVQLRTGQTLLWILHRLLLLPLTTSHRVPLRTSGLTHTLIPIVQVLAPLRFQIHRFTPPLTIHFTVLRQLLQMKMNDVRSSRALTPSFFSDEGFQKQVLRMLRNIQGVTNYEGRQQQEEKEGVCVCACIGGNQDRAQIMRNFTTPSITRRRMRVINVAAQVDIRWIDTPPWTSLA